MRAAGADNINLSLAAIEWVGPNTATMLVYNTSGASADEFTLGEIKGEAPVLQTRKTV